MADTSVVFQGSDDVWIVRVEFDVDQLNEVLDEGRAQVVSRIFCALLRAHVDTQSPAKYKELMERARELAEECYA